MRVMGLGCSLDTVRFRSFLSEAAGVSIDSVSGIVIGSHNDAMIPLVRHATIGGAGINHVLDSTESPSREPRTADPHNRWDSYGSGRRLPGGWGRVTIVQCQACAD